jgi:hypothetical protein
LKYRREKLHPKTNFDEPDLNKPRNKFSGAEGAKNSIGEIRIQTQPHLLQDRGVFIKKRKSVVKIMPVDYFP